MDEVVRLIPRRLWVWFLLRHGLLQSMNMHARLIRDSKIPEWCLWLARTGRCLRSRDSASGDLCLIVLRDARAAPSAVPPDAQSLAPTGERSAGSYLGLLMKDSLPFMASVAFWPEFGANQGFSEGMKSLQCEACVNSSAADGKSRLLAVIYQTQW